jgi:hypothetical protein
MSEMAARMADEATAQMQLVHQMHLLRDQERRLYQGC